MKKKIIDKALLIYIVNLGLLISFIAVAITGILMYPGLIPALGISYRDIPLDAISTIHNNAGLAMVILVVFHIIFYYRVLVNQTIRYIFRKNS